MAKKSRKLSPPLAFEQHEDRRQAQRFVASPDGFDGKFVATIAWVAGQGYRLEVRLDSACEASYLLPITDREFSSVGEAQRHVESQIANVQRLYGDPSLLLSHSDCPLPDIANLAQDLYQILAYEFTTEDGDNLEYIVFLELWDDGTVQVTSYLQDQDHPASGTTILNKEFPDFSSAEAVANLYCQQVDQFIRTLRSQGARRG